MKIEEAHKLSAHVFGVQQIEHYKVNVPRDGDSINKSVYQGRSSYVSAETPYKKLSGTERQNQFFSDKSLEKEHSVGELSAAGAQTRENWRAVISKRKNTICRILKLFPEKMQE